MAPILIVEDEVKIATVLQDYLKQSGYAAEIINDGNKVIDSVKTARPQLILLDIMLPSRDGLELCREIRTFSDVPIIMITARIEEIDRLLGLELGADDYVCKPFSPREVVARVKANLRRSTAVTSQSDTPTETGFHIDELQYSVSFDQAELDLTPVEFRMLQALLNPPGRVYSRDQLLNHMYEDYRVVSDRTVDSHVTNLRRKLQAVRPDSDCIQSIYGVGYKLAV